MSEHYDYIVSAAVILSSVLTAFVLLMPRVSRSTLWRATVTPLASIIGSGFLVLGPILASEFGNSAPLVMLGLCITAYAFGSAIRFNIRHSEQIQNDDLNAIRYLETVSSCALALAYVVSVTYYLNLLGSFAVSLTEVNDVTSARLVTTCVLSFIGFYGLFHGLKKLEDLEETSVTIKLAIIGGLLVGMLFYAGKLLSGDGLVGNPTPSLSTHSLFLAFGLVICVQGFETSRYLSEEYDAETRVSTMKASQWSSTAIYLVYTTLIAFSFDASQMETSETAIIGITQVVAPVLPTMLVAAALAAQFSAAVADTAGCGGLLSELTKGRIPSGVAYLAVTFGGLALTWTADVYQIIAYASRAFAIYYALQSAVAAVIAFRTKSRRLIFFCALASIGTLIAVFGISPE